MALLSTALVLALSISASQLNRGSVVPYMLSAFVERVLDASSDDRLLQTPSSDLPGQMWTRVNEISFHYPWVVGPNLAEQTRGLIEVESAERSILAFAAYIGRLGGPAIADNLRRVQKSYRGAEEDGLTTQRQVDTALIEIPVVAVSEYMRSHPEIAELPPELLPMMEQAVAQLGFQSILQPRQLDHLPFGPVRFSAYALFERIGLSAHLPPDLLSKAPNCILAKPVGLWLLRSGEVRRAIALQKHCTLQAIAEGISAMLRADHDYEAVSQYLQAFDPLFAGPGPGCADQSRCADIRAVDFANSEFARPSEELICRSVVCATLETLSNDEAATEQAAALVNLWQADGDACRTAGDLWGAWTHVVSELSSPFPEEVSALIAECSRGDSSSGRFVIQQLQTTPMPERLALAEALKTRQLEPYPSLQETCGLVPTTLVAYEAVADPTGEIAFVRRAMKRIIEVRNSAAKREYALPCLNALASAGRRLGDYDTAALARSVSLEQFGEDQARSSHAADVAEAALEAVLSGDYPTAFKYVDGSDADPALRLRVLIALADGAIVHLTAPEDFPEELNPL
ncbi:MAG TPA: hypothetical protein VG757_04830 [Devosia sp.]|nr:hypothetical protein [Devosia sp.]